MEKIQFDPGLVIAGALEVTERFNLILKLFPKNMSKEDQKIINHLAAASIHIACFMKDIRNHLNEEQLPDPRNMKQFLENCGCDFNNDFKPTNKEAK
jgi:hypothetical protein